MVPDSVPTFALCFRSIVFFLIDSGHSHQIARFLKDQKQFHWLLVKSQSLFEIEAHCTCTLTDCYGSAWLCNVPDRKSVVTCDQMPDEINKLVDDIDMLLELLNILDTLMLRPLL